MNKKSAAFAIDTNFPDRVFLGSVDDFLAIGVVLKTILGHELPIMIPQPTQMQAPALSPPFSGASDSTQNNGGHQLNTPAISPVTD